MLGEKLVFYGITKYGFCYIQYFDIAYRKWYYFICNLNCMYLFIKYSKAFTQVCVTSFWDETFIFKVKKLLKLYNTSAVVKV